MTLDEAIELGRAWPSWAWAPGQVYIFVVCGHIHQSRRICMSSEDPGYGEAEAFPDLRDPGTRGHALEQVREAWGDDEATAAPDGTWKRWRMRIVVDGVSVNGDMGGALEGDTEAAALLAARRAAP